MCFVVNSAKGARSNCKWRGTETKCNSIQEIWKDLEKRNKCIEECYYGERNKELLDFYFKH